MTQNRNEFPQTLMKIVNYMNFLIYKIQKSKYLRDYFDPITKRTEELNTCLININKIKQLTFEEKDVRKKLVFFTRNKNTKLTGHLLLENESTFQ